MSQSDPEYGLNGAQVRIFLGELRSINLDRAIEVWNAYAVAGERGYAEALEAAKVIASKQRTHEWLLARQAAATIARERLGDPAMVGEVVEVLATVAGSIVIRDLITRPEFRLLQLPWTWDGESTGLPLAAAAAAGIAAVPARAPWHLGGFTATPVAAGIGVVAVALVVGAVALFGRPTSNVAVVEPTDSQLPSAQATVLFEPSPLTSPGASPGTSVPPSPLETTGTPSAQPGPTTAPPPPASSGPGPTHPPAPTPRPTPKPPPPTPTPQAMCDVISLIDLNTVKAQEKWAAAGFTGAVAFSPAVPPQYRIAWQSLTAGTSVTCSHGITVSDKTP